MKKITTIFLKITIKSTGKQCMVLSPYAFLQFSPSLQIAKMACWEVSQTLQIVRKRPISKPRFARLLAPCSRLKHLKCKSTDSKKIKKYHRRKWISLSRRWFVSSESIRQLYKFIKHYFNLFPEQFVIILDVFNIIGVDIAS